MLAASAARRGPLAGLIEPHRVAVSGHSDGGETGRGSRLRRHYRPPRAGGHHPVRRPAAGHGLSTSRSAKPPLLGCSGTADTTDLPQFTHAFQSRSTAEVCSAAGAGHLAPAPRTSDGSPSSSGVTIAFLDRYLKHMPNAKRRLIAAGDVAGKSVIAAEPLEISLLPQRPDRVSGRSQRSAAAAPAIARPLRRHAAGLLIRLKPTVSDA